MSWSVRVLGAACVCLGVAVVAAPFARGADKTKPAATAKSRKGASDATAAKAAKTTEVKDAKADKVAKSAKPAAVDSVPGHPGVKIRQGSFLRKNESEPDAIDLRGELERRRDFEMRLHYARMAELDVIGEVAKQERDGAMLERVEAVRRKEERRYWAVMQDVRDLAWQKIVWGAP